MLASAAFCLGKPRCWGWWGCGGGAELPAAGAFQLPSRAGRLGRSRGRGPLHPGANPATLGSLSPWHGPGGDTGAGRSACSALALLRWPRSDCQRGLPAAPLKALPAVFIVRPHRWGPGSERCSQTHRRAGGGTRPRGSQTLAAGALLWPSLLLPRWVLGGASLLVPGFRNILEMRC